MDLFCPVHKEVKADIERIERTQEARHCIAHEVQIKDLRGETTEQWTAINNLKRMVYLGAGVVWAVALFGSIIGNLLINYLKR